MAEREVTTVRKAFVYERWLVDVPDEVIAEGHEAIKTWLAAAIQANEDGMDVTWPEQTTDYWTESDSDSEVVDYRPLAPDAAEANDG